MREALPTRSGKRPVAFVADGVGSVVYSDHSNADRVATASPELDYLIAEIVHDAVDLLDHGLRQDLYFYSDLHGCYGASGNKVSGVRNRNLSRNNLPECAVATTSGNTSPFVLDVENAIFAT